jgi:hypothetical protein
MGVHDQIEIERSTPILNHVRTVLDQLIAVSPAGRTHAPRSSRRQRPANQPHARTPGLDWPRRALTQAAHAATRAAATKLLSVLLFHLPLSSDAYADTLRTCRAAAGAVHALLLARNVRMPLSIARASRGERPEEGKQPWTAGACASARAYADVPQFQKIKLTCHYVIY